VGIIYDSGVHLRAVKLTSLRKPALSVQQLESRLKTRDVPAWCVFVCLLAGVSAATKQTSLRDELIRVGGFTAAEVAQFDAGQVIVRVAPANNAREVAVLGAVRIRSAKENTLSYFTQFISFEDGEVTLQFGRFSRPPAVSDVSRLTLEPGDLDALKNCRPGDCDVRLGAAAMTELRQAIDWTAADAGARANQLAQERITAYVTDYLARGNEALITYNDRQQPVKLLDEWQGLLANTRNFGHYAPALKDYLDRFPRSSLPGASDVIYWAKENYGLPKPVVHVTHMVVWRDPARTDRILVAQKQLYASHYYDGSLALTAILDAPAADGRPASDLLYFNRSRGDLLKGGFGGLRQRVARDQAKTAAVQTLTTIRDVLEKAAGLR
jgi:hypothetical protein